MVKLLILDLDGTLFDTSARWEQCQKLFPNNKKEFWNCFQSEKYMSLDTPKENVISLAKSLIDSDTVVVVVSGRSERQREKTIEQLKSINITPNEVYLRKDKDFRKDYQFKSDIISQLLQKYNPQEVIIIDDSDEVINYISSKFSIKIIDAKKL
jgi:hydroxymethylpyrimidine pyrophosphatase-like HAD family hydrolase